MKLCKICLLPTATRKKIDALLFQGVAYKTITQKFGHGKFSYGSVGRHRRHLLPEDVIRKAPPPPPETGRSLLDRVETLVTESRTIANAAKTQQQWVAATSALREVRCCLELLGKLTGEISSINFNTFNFANIVLNEEQLCAILENVKSRPQIRGVFTRLLSEKFPFLCAPVLNEASFVASEARPGEHSFVESDGRGNEVGFSEDDFDWRLIREVADICASDPEFRKQLLLAIGSEDPNPAAAALLVLPTNGHEN
jgi:hypothetical protein